MTTVLSTPAMREVLLDAALTVLRRDGAGALTVRSITQQAGCSTTGVYTYFGGKHGVVEAIYVDGFESFDRALTPAYQAREFVESGRAYRRWALTHPTQYLVMFGRAVPEFVPSQAALERAVQSFGLLIEAVRAVSRGGDIETQAYHVFATVHGYVMLELVNSGHVDPIELEALYEAGLQHVMRSLS